MAVWQFDLYFIARDASAPNMDAEGWDAPPLPLSIVYDVQTELANYLGPPWMMLPDWLVFGPERGNRVDTLFENEVEASVFVRCDVRDEAPQLKLQVERFKVGTLSVRKGQTKKGPATWRAKAPIPANGH